MRAGDCAAFPKNDGNGHHLVNRSDCDAVYLEVGTRSDVDECRYPDIDLFLTGDDGHFRHKDGRIYGEAK